MNWESKRRGDGKRFTSCLHWQVMLQAASFRRRVVQGSQAGAAPYQAGLQQTPGPWFCQPLQVFSFAFLHVNGYLVNTARKQRWGTYFEGLQKVASGFHLPAVEVFLGRGAQGTKASPSELMLKPGAIWCSAPPPASASKHLGSACVLCSLGITTWALWEILPSVSNLLTDLLLHVSGTCFRKHLSDYLCLLVTAICHEVVLFMHHSTDISSLSAA